MTRALVYSLVLVMTIGPVAATLCSVVCEAQPAATACVHEHGSAALRIDPVDQCYDIGISLPQGLKEHIRRSAPTSANDMVSSARDLPVPPLMVISHLAKHSRPTGFLDSGPVSVALRI